MADTKRCPQCGAQLAADAPKGLCPQCLLKQAMATVDPPVDDPVATSSPIRRFSAPTPDELSARFPELEILALHNQGGMGAVYKARQKTLHRAVALKILPLEVGPDPAFAERFTREAQALAKLTHPNIVTIYEFGQRDGLYYVLMEFVDGVNLRQAIQSKSLSQHEALAIVPQICDALHYAHEAGVVHRDVKPENVLLDNKGRVKIVDFGLAKMLGRSPLDVTLTASHQVMGTLHYMAPEQIERPLEVDHRADIYSLGVVFYELLTGELPLGRFKLPSESASLDARLDNVVLKTLEREPAQRYQYASDVKTDVEQIARSDRPQPRPHVPPSPRWISVPFTIRRHSVAAAHGVAKFDGRQLTFDFEVPEQVSKFPFFSGLKVGLHEVTIAVGGIADASFEPGWFHGKLRIQTSSVRHVHELPASERAGVTMEISKRDFQLAVEFASELQRCVHGAGAPVAAISSGNR